MSELKNKTNCLHCWWQEGGHCYEGEYVCNNGSSNKLAIKVCGKHSILEQIIPTEKLIIIGELNEIIYEKTESVTR